MSKCIITHRERKVNNINWDDKLLNFSNSPHYVEKSSLEKGSENENNVIKDYIFTAVFKAICNP